MMEAFGIGLAVAVVTFSTTYGIVLLTIMGTKLWRRIRTFLKENGITE